jgi:hypothetical protein
LCGFGGNLSLEISCRDIILEQEGVEMMRSERDRTIVGGEEELS